MERPGGEMLTRYDIAKGRKAKIKRRKTVAVKKTDKAAQHRIGDIYLKTGGVFNGPFLLARVSVDNPSVNSSLSKIVLVGLKDGNRWVDPVEVLEPECDNIVSKEDFVRCCGDSEAENFKLIDKKELIKNLCQKY